MLEGITPLHLILILGIALIVLGPGKLPEAGAALGRTIREFRKSVSDTGDALRIDLAAPSATAATPVAGLLPAVTSPAVPAPAVVAVAVPSAGTTVSSVAPDDEASPVGLG